MSRSNTIIISGTRSQPELHSSVQTLPLRYNTVCCAQCTKSHESRVTTTHTRTLAAPQCATHFHFNNSKRRFPISSFEVFWVPFRAVVFVSRMKRSIFIFFSFFLFRLRRCVLTLFRMLFSRSCWCSLSFVVCFACCLYNGRRYSPKTQMRLGGVAVETITKMTKKKRTFHRIDALTFACEKYSSILLSKRARK